MWPGMGVVCRARPQQGKALPEIHHNLALMAAAMVVVCSLAISPGAQAAGIGECVELSDAMCSGLGLGCGDAVSLPQILVEQQNAQEEPCLSEEIEGRCKEADEPETFESLDADSLAAAPEPSQPSRLNLACDGSDSQCSGLPAPEQAQQLRTPMPTPYQVSPIWVTTSRWALDLEDFSASGIAPREGVASNLDQPPQA